MILSLIVLAFIALLVLAPILGVDSRPRSEDPWERDSLWSHRG